ncbi:MAG: FUSC family protein [Chitinophagaceae bacterium]|nr:FUSC family protein [Chitinophagaceae bacterium]
MKYTRAYKSFVNSQYLYEGVKVATGILIPALLMSYFGMISSGILISLGAMCVSITDSPGPILHRRNGMIACIISIFIVSMATGVSVGFPVLLGLVIFICCFLFSMLSVYGARAGALGIASLLIMVLDIDQRQYGWQVIIHALFIASGGLWYLCYSSLLYNFRPYKLAQQALGENIESIAEYLRLRANFYKRDIIYETNYRALLQQQAMVQEKQTMLSELLFKTRQIVQSTTTTGRILVMIYMDIADMFERIMTSYQYYETLHTYFDETGILDEYQKLARMLADEIEEIGIAVKSASPSLISDSIPEKIKETSERLDSLRSTFMKPENIDGFLNLRRILENVQDIYARVKTLHLYTTYDRSLTKKQLSDVDFERYISHQEITPQMLIDNLSLRSDTFRHSLRVSIAVIIGYIGSLFFPLGHSYWILLTIVVILKPAYSLSKSRNIDRLMGTILGIIIGIPLIYFIENKTVLLLVMIVLMMGTYVFIRKHYFISVLFMTPYIIIFFHLLNPATFKAVLMDRIIDTAIGSVIAFGASMFLFPAWEREKIRPVLITMLTGAVNYLHSLTSFFDGLPAVEQHKQKVARKDALVAMANLSDAFNRMVSEPKRMQHSIEEIHHFVVLCHMLMSHIATLSQFIQRKDHTELTAEFLLLINYLVGYLKNAKAKLEETRLTDDVKQIKEALRRVNEHANAILQQRQVELSQGLTDTETRKQLVRVKSIVDQFNFIFNVTCDLNKTAEQIAAASL